MQTSQRAPATREQLGAVGGFYLQVAFTGIWAVCPVLYFDGVDDNDDSQVTEDRGGYGGLLAEGNAVSKAE